MFLDTSSREQELHLVPLSGMELAKPQRESIDATWVARTGRPEFEVVGLEPFRGQWVRLRFRLQVDQDEWSWPRLSFDLGTGDFDACGIPLPVRRRQRPRSNWSSTSRSIFVRRDYVRLRVPEDSN